MFHDWVKHERSNKSIERMGLEIWSCTNPDCDYKDLACSKDPRIVAQENFQKYGVGASHEDECPHIPSKLCVDGKEPAV